ncbi:MAG: superoxide dismutase [Acidobacteriota bacterium]|jgi:Fe-Mn family superoxide dismutase
MKLIVPDLPYSKDALEPNISAATVDVHYEKHHKGYLRKLKKAVEGKPDAERDLEDLIRTTSGGLFNNAAQVWNHTFYWNSMSPKGGGKPEGRLLKEIDASFGSFEDFKQQLAEAATGQFGSGWAWLVTDGKKLRVESTSDADNPLRQGRQPLLALDVWEHAYYLDYKNERNNYVDRFIDNLIHWKFVAEQLAAFQGAAATTGA